MANHKTVDGFTAAVQKRVEKDMPKEATKVVRRVALAAYSYLLKESPVDKGTYRSNWYPAVNEIPDEYDLDLTSAPIRPIGEFKLGDTLVHANSVPYAARIESGWSKQAPQGVAAPVRRKLENQIKSGRL